MSDLIPQLAQLIAQDNALLFVGAGLRQELGDESIVAQIADALAARIDYQKEDRSLEAVARDFQALNGRPALVRALVEEVEKLGVQPAPIHQLIADAVLPSTKVITTRFDRLLERALDQFAKPYVLIKRDEDLVAFDEGRVTLIKIMGDIQEPESLVITEDDVDRFIRRLPTVSDLIRAYLATKTLIFIGYDLNSRHFRRFLLQVTDDLGDFRRHSYAITNQPVGPADQRYWAEQKVEIQQRDPLAFLEELAAAVKEASRREQPPQAEENLLAGLANLPLPDHPYKALESFQASDAAIFAGREQESQRLANRILARRLTVLYGESGSGKTSLLQAGAGPKLAGQRALLAVAVPAPGQSLNQALEAALLAAGQAAGLEPAADRSSLAPTLREWQRQVGGPVVLAADQFEQVFVAYDSAELAAVVETLRALKEERSLDLRLVLVLREDFLGRLQTLESVLPDLLDVRFRLERLGREAARAAIVEPAKLFHVEWQPELVERLLDELDEGQGRGVAPPVLQVVCARLYDEALAWSGQQVHHERLVIPESLYEQLGGAGTILGDYLDQAVSGLEAAQQPVARALLGALVSSGGTRQRLALADLARAAEVEPAAARPILDSLARRRLVRLIEPAGEGPLQVELVHDMLVPRIARWLGEEFWNAQKVREILRLALPEWQKRGRLPAADDLRLAAAQHGRVHFSPAESELLYAAAVAYGEDAALWAADLEVGWRQPILLRLLDAQAAEPEARSRAAAELAQSGGEAAAQPLARLALSDPEPAVRQAAAQAIAGLAQRGDSAAAPAVQQLTQDGSEAGLAALTLVRDAAPASQDLLPAELRSSVRRRVWRLRWRRHWPEILATTVQGVQGGFIGLGLGLGLVLGLAPVRGNTNMGLILALLVIGFIVAGVMGGLATGAGSLAGAALQALQDQERIWRTWAVKVAASTLAFSPVWIVLRLGAPSAEAARPGLLATLAAVLLAGLLTAGVAALPLKAAWPVRLLLAIGGGVIAFFLAGLLGLYGRSLSQDVVSVLMLGAGSGLGFFAGLNPRFWRRAALATLDDLS